MGPVAGYSRISGFAPTGVKYFPLAKSELEIVYVASGEPKYSASKTGSSLNNSVRKIYIYKCTMVVENKESNPNKAHTVPQLLGSKAQIPSGIIYAKPRIWE